ncbi:hypothetical protein NW768_002174 [Fusarium equiseti]|uniref:RING-type domain-containing protein n=1 Tax=Fusarium equiseti TaxID=61235 RepID=A0ABQ8RMQ6_FUSEQ|nr:hypothetical protein NW768_002174 [Fusarium equiseti]
MKNSFPETYLPYLMDVIQGHPRAADCTTPMCQICTEPATLNEDVPHVNLVPDLQKIKNPPHAAYVLPCGHIFGLSCATAMLKYNQYHHTQHKCPTCGFVLSCSHGWSKDLQGNHNKGVLLSLSQDKRERMLEVVDAALKLPHSCLPCFMIDIAKEARCLPPDLEALFPDLPLKQRVAIQCRRDDEGWKIIYLQLKGSTDVRLSTGGYSGRLLINSRMFRRDQIIPQLRDMIENTLNQYMKAFDVFSLHPERDCIWIKWSQAEDVTRFHHFLIIERGNIGKLIRSIMSPTKT